MTITIEITEQDLKKLVTDEIQRLAGDVPVNQKDIKIETKSRQNYKSEWESAAFRASATITV